MEACCHDGNPERLALRDSSSAFTNPNVRQPMKRQSRAAKTERKNPTPVNCSSIKAPQYHARKYRRAKSFENI